MTAPPALATPFLFVGETERPVLLQVGDGYLDDDAPYELYSDSRKQAPQGEDMEAVFPLLHITTKHYDVDVSFWVTVIVDDVMIVEQRIDLKGVRFTQGIEQTHTLALFQAYIDPATGAEAIRTAPRGTWIEVFIETKYAQAESGAAPAAAKQIVQSVLVEFDPVRSSRQAVAVTPG